MSPRPHALAVAQAVVVTILWSTSFILIKHALAAIGPVTLAGLRYAMAFGFLALYARVVDRRPLVRLPWGTLIAIGVLQYGLAQAFYNAALQYLPVATVALMFSLLPALMALTDTFWLREPPRVVQIVGAAVTVGGIALYLPWQGAGAWQGLALMSGTLVAVTVSTALSRAVARTGTTPTLALTMVSMGAGALAILPAGLGLEAAPRFPPSVVASLLWLAVANTAAAFSLWNHALRTLTAFEINVIANLVLFQVGILGWIFLDETLSARHAAGMVVAAAGVVLAQRARGRAAEPT